MTVSHHRLLYLQRSVLRHRQAVRHRRAYRGAARLAEQQGGTRIDVDEYLFQRDLRRALLTNHLGKTVQYGFEAGGELAAGRPDASAGDVVEAAADLVDD